MRDVAENIRRAKELIADPAFWVQRAWYIADLTLSKPKRCAYSALCAITKDLPYPECDALAEAMGSCARGSAAGTKVVNFNDNNSHAKVMELFDKAAIKTADSRGAT